MTRLASDEFRVILCRARAVMKRVVRSLIVIWLIAVGSGSLSSAWATLLLDLNSGGSQIPCGGCGSDGATFGWAFVVTNTVNIGSLGVWDAGADGIGPATQVGLWNSDSTLLASVVVTDASAPTASASVDGRWLMETIAPVTLVPGAYRVGAVFFELTPVPQINVTYVIHPSIGSITPAGTLPDTGLTVPLMLPPFILFGPTLGIVSDMPEPNAAALLLASLVGMASMRYRTSRH